MIKIVQFGEGNFLRAFADAYFDSLNYGVTEKYAVHVVKPIPDGSIEKFAAQNNRYHIILRGMENGVPVEKVREIRSLESVISPFDNPDAYYALAKERELKIIVSNTTESGIRFCESDTVDAPLERISFPAKLTKFLYERFKAGLPGVYLLPVELIENNADELRRCVDSYISLWNLPEKFRKWNESENMYCNTLVDRIVSGYPRDTETKSHIEELIGGQDALLSVCEPFGFWAIENKGDIANYIQTGFHNVEVVLTDDIAYYKKRKVRVLNGSHTNLVAVGLMLGKETVYDCMIDERLATFVDETLQNEIIPFVSDNIYETTVYGESVKERFLNPYLNHRLESIALNSLSKWRARVLPSFKDYYAKYGKIPNCFTIGFSYLVAMYYERYSELKDESRFLELFSAGKSIKEIMSEVEIWGEDLTQYTGFEEAVKGNVVKIIRRENLI